MMDRYSSTRPKAGIGESSKLVSASNVQSDASSALRLPPAFPEESYQSGGDEGGFFPIGQTVSSEARQKLNLIWPVYELCNSEASKMHNYVQLLAVFPRLIITAANRSLLNIVNNLATIEAAGKGDGRFEFYYVSAGPLGNGYYLSTLLFRHSIFESEPILPAAFMIHERRSPDDHRRLFELIQEKCPEVASTACTFITDREFGNVKSVLPSAMQFFSWHYFEDDIVNWVETSAGTNDDANNFINDVFNLMKSKTTDEFNRELAIKKRQWPPDFAHYFETSLKSDILLRGGRWHAEQGRPGTYDPFCGVVIPACTDLNQLVSDLVEWQEVTLEQLLMCTYYFSEYYVREHEMAMHQAGNYKLKAAFSHLSRPIRRMRAYAAAEIAEPREVVSYVRTSALFPR